MLFCLKFQRLTLLITGFEAGVSDATLKCIHHTYTKVSHPLSLYCCHSFLGPFFYFFIFLFFLFFFFFGGGGETKLCHILSSENLDKRCDFCHYDVYFLLPVNVGEDCPVFDGMYEFCQLSTGGSVGKWLLGYKAPTTNGWVQRLHQIWLTLSQTSPGFYAYAV